MLPLKRPSVVVIRVSLIGLIGEEWCSFKGEILQGEAVHVGRQLTL